MAQSIQRLPAVTAAAGLKRSSIYAYMQSGLWPKSVAIGARAVGWPQSEVEAVIAARIAGKNEAAIRALVTKLEAARAVAA